MTICRWALSRDFGLLFSAPWVYYSPILCAGISPALLVPLLNDALKRLPCFINSIENEEPIQNLCSPGCVGSSWGHFRAWTLYLASTSISTSEYGIKVRSEDIYEQVIDCNSRRSASACRVVYRLVASLTRDACGVNISSSRPASTTASHLSLRMRRSLSAPLKPCGHASPSAKPPPSL